MVEGKRDPGRAAREQAIGAAEHGVLFVQDGLDAGALGRQHRRDRSVAAEADHDRGRQAAQDGARLEPAAHQLQRAARPRHQAAAGQAAGADVMHLDLGLAVAEALAARIGDERHAAAARDQLAGQRLGREHVAAGAAGGEHDEGPGPVHDGFRRHDRSPRPTRRRVSASSMPMPSDSASSDEPP